MYVTTNRGADLVASGGELVYKLLVTLVEKLKSCFAGAPAYGPESCKTPAELASYAHSIKDREPGFAADLLSAVGRHEG